MNNNKTPKNIAQYIASIMNNRPVEKNSEFDEWMKTNRYSYEISKRISDEKYLSDAVKSHNSLDGEKHINNMRLKLRKMRNKKLVLKITSISAALLAISLLILDTTQRDSVDVDSKSNSELVAAKNDNGVRLIVGDGTTLSLEDITTSTSTTNNVIITKREEATVALSSENVTAASVMRFIVPYKKTYSIVLPDGTKVMLNADSEIEFLSRFDGNTREVALKGEAYFDVRSDKEKPFIVHTNGVSIVVHGTKFNVNSYDKELVKTLLVEGVVAVSMENSKEVFLKPNQLSIANTKSRELNVSNVINIDDNLSWLKNSFVFSEQAMTDVIKIMERWYGVRVEMQGTSDARITAEFTKNSELSEIIGVLEILSNTKLKIIADDIK